MDTVAIGIGIGIGIILDSVETVLHIFIEANFIGIRIGVSIGIGVGHWKHTINTLLILITVCNSTCRKVMLSQVSVCPLGVGVHPPVDRHHPLARHPLSRHPPGRYPLGRHPPGQTPRADTPSPQMATAVDGTHPTGMHSSSLDFIDVVCKSLYNSLCF